MRTRSLAVWDSTRFIEIDFWNRRSVFRTFGQTLRRRNPMLLMLGQQTLGVTFPDIQLQNLELIRLHYLLSVAFTDVTGRGGALRSGDVQHYRQTWEKRLRLRTSLRRRRLGCCSPRATSIRPTEFATGSNQSRSVGRALVGTPYRMPRLATRSRGPPI